MNILELARKGYFTVDAEGGVWRCFQRTRTGRWKTITPVRADRPRGDGYRWVRAYVARQWAGMPAHCLVWVLANGPIPGGLEINHRNGDRGDNRLENLELQTTGGNLLHAYRELGRVRMSGERNGRHKLSAADVVTIRARQGASARGLAREYGVTHRVILRVRRGDAWKDEYPEVHP